MKSVVKLSAFLLIALLLASCAASHGAPNRPWRVAVTTTGGIAGRGTGDFAIASDGKVEARLFDGRECRFTASAAELRRFEELLGKARPREWKRSYVPENPCCDRFEYTLTYDEASVETTTKWIDDPLPMPADLVALADAIVGGAASLRVIAAERCQ